MPMQERIFIRIPHPLKILFDRKVKSEGFSKSMVLRKMIASYLADKIRIDAFKPEPPPRNLN
ncbi:hypothetical protein ES703_49275 [subsurface metagenome]